MRRVFLDMGTHYGQGMREFMRMYNMDESWIIHTFEANPKTYKKFVEEYLHLTPFVFHHNLAVSDTNSIATIHQELYREENGTGQGSSIIPLSNWNTNQAFIGSESVATINISTFITTNFNPDDFIVIKMDIEGSEYDVLEKMIAHDSISYVNDLYVEWHKRCFINDISERELALQKILPTKVDKLATWI